MTAPNSTAPTQPRRPATEPQAARPLDARALLELLESRGARLEARGDRLAVDAPRSLIGAFAGEIARFKPQLLELLAPTGSDTGAQRQSDDGSDTDKTDDADERARDLLANYRRGGAALSLEEIEHAGATWLALACDLTNVPRLKRDRAFEQVQRHAREIQRALELEADSSHGDAQLDTGDTVNPEVNA